MKVQHRRVGDNVIYAIDGPFDEEAAHQYFDLNYEDYHEIGDAMGTVLDFRGMTELHISGLTASQKRMKGVVFDTPVAFVGTPNKVLMAFVSGLEAISSLSRRRFRFFEGDEPVREALAWLDGWFEANSVDREAVRGMITARPTPPK